MQNQSWRGKVKWRVDFLEQASWRKIRVRLCFVNNVDVLILRLCSTDYLLEVAKLTDAFLTVILHC